MTNSFRLVGINYKTASLALREKVSFQEADAKAFMLQLNEILDLQDILLVSTCNRTEIYYTSSEDKSEEIIKLLKVAKSVDIENFASSFFINNDQNAVVEHLYYVSAGLEAQVVGDMQIINQVKNAYQWSADLNMAGAFLHRLLHSIFYTNKRIVQETSFRDGAASVSYATVELIEDIVSNYDEHQVLVVGLGEIGEDVCRHLQNSKFKNVSITNRTIEKAQKIAEECNLNVIDYAKFEKSIFEADIIISCVGNSHPIITKGHFKNFDLYSHKYIVDLAVPRSVENEVESIPGIILYNIDEIQSKSNEALAKRMEAIPAVKNIISDSITGLNDWSQEMLFSPTINKLKIALEQIRQEEIARYTKKLTEQESELVEKVTKGMMQKLIKLPVLQLKAACKRGEAETLVDVLNDLFDLEKVKTN
jgi:glutamyl-tRNA reductase